jgi:type II restriction enzyme
MANTVLNRRKSRAGKSLEHHLSAIFDGNGLIYKSQAVTEGNKKPDFIFPSQEAYHDFSFPTEKLISLAAKTTCKDRWRQVLNEADRLRGRPKYLYTLQQGISPAQMDEIQEEQVILVVPKAYIGTCPEDRRDRIWTLEKFVSFVKETEEIR